MASDGLAAALRSADISAEVRRAARPRRLAQAPRRAGPAPDPPPGRSCAAAAGAAAAARPAQRGAARPQRAPLPGVDQEGEAFQARLKDPEFMRLFEEYAKDLAAPEVRRAPAACAPPPGCRGRCRRATRRRRRAQARAESDAYLRQLEAQGQLQSVYGAGVRLIQPRPGLVVKTRDAAGGGAARVYVNVCTSDQVAPPSKTPAGEGGRGGVSLCVPMVMAPKARDGAARDSGPLRVWDLAVHPDALADADANPRAKAALVEMALERVEEVGGGKLLRSYKLPRLKFKAAAGEEGPASSRSSFRFAPRRPASRAQPQAAPADPSKPGFRHACGAVTPEWTLSEQCKVDLGQTWRDTGRALKPGSTVPEALVVRVLLPGVASSAAVQLDAAADGVEVAVPGRFLLRLALRRAVLPQRGVAKFDSAKHQLTLTLPVVQPAPEEPECPPAEQPGGAAAAGEQGGAAAGEQDGAAAGEPDGAASEQDGAAAGEQEGAQAEPPLVQLPPDGAGDVEGAALERGGEAPPPHAAAAAAAAEKTANQLLWEEVHGAPDSQARQPDQLAVAAGGGEVAAAKAASAVPRPAPAPVVLKLRLLSGQVRAADLD
ncbi:Nop17l [Scenedesmus sp. PABB004]|nr:Nop17l [Scenedesmus sp. PABB004]